MKLENMDTATRNPALTEWKKGWLTVVSAFFLIFITDGLMFSFGILLVEIIDQFAIGRAMAGATVAIMVIIMHLVGPLAVALADKFGHRAIVVIGSIMSSTGLFLCWWATNVYYLWFLYGFFGGLGFGLMLTANVCVLNAFEKHRAVANGITVCGSGTGTFVFNYGLRILIDYYGWRGAILLESGIVLQGAIFGLLLSNHRKKVKKLTKDNSSCATCVKLFLASLFKRELLTDMRCIMFLLSTSVISFAFLVPMTFIPDQVEQAGMTKAEASILTSSIGIANIISRVIFGWIGDYICCKRLNLVVIIILLIGLLTGASPFLETFQSKLAYTSMFGVLIGGYVCLFTVVLVDMVKAELIGNAFGLIQLSIGIGNIAAPIAGVLFDQTGSYTITFIVCGAEFILGAIFMLMCNCFRPKDYLYKVNAHGSSI